MLAPLVEQFFDKPTTQLMAEIRLNEERLGATPIDRLRLGYKMPITPVPTVAGTSRPRGAGALDRAAARAGADVPASSRDRLTRIHPPSSAGTSQEVS